MRVDIPSTISSPHPNNAQVGISTWLAWIATILPYMLLSGTHVIMAQTDVVMIGYFLGTKSSGIYSAAAQTAVLIAFSLIAVNTIAAPMIAELYALNRRPELQRIITLAARGNLLFALPASLFLMVMGKPVLGLFGTEFPTAHLALGILAVGQLVNALAGSVGFLMTMTGHHWQTVLVLSLAAFLNIALNLLLIPYFGLAGAASASAISLALWNIVLTWRVKVILHIDPTIFTALTSAKHSNETT